MVEQVQVPLQGLAKKPAQVLIDAVRAGDLEAVKNTLAHGISINSCDEHLNTALHQACMKSNFEMVRYLLERGADIESKNEKGETPLMVASARPFVNLVRLLLSRGASVEGKSSEGLTPLDYAHQGMGFNASSINREVIRELERRGARRSKGLNQFIEL